MSVGIMESLFHKTEDEYLQCKNNIFEELINFVYLSEDIKKFHIMIVQYQDAPFKNLQFIHTIEHILSALLFEQNIIRDNINKLKLQLKECKKIIKEQRKNLNE
jgi:hypothetical protein